MKHLKKLLILTTFFALSGTFFVPLKAMEDNSKTHTFGLNLLKTGAILSACAVTEVLLEAYFMKGLTPLHVASTHNLPQVARALLS